MIEQPALPPPRQASVISDVAAERRRQTEVKGWTSEHDDAHRNGELAVAAAAYAIHRIHSFNSYSPAWPWDATWWKPTTARRDLVKAAALLVAEIERLDRISAGEASDG